MKKMLFMAACAALAVGCASGNTATTNTTQPLTLDQALQKSAETRAQLQQAKQDYENAKNASKAAGGSSSATDGVKAQIQQKLEDAKTQVDNEVQAWKEVLK